MFLPLPCPRHSMIFFHKKFFPAPKPFLSRNGFTLLELLLSVGLMALLAGIAAPMYLSLQAENEVAISATSVGDLLRTAQARSLAVSGDSAWGVYLSGNVAVIFKGNSFSDRDQSFDENYNFSGAINFSGLNDIVFYKFSGWTMSSGTIKVSHQDGRFKNVSINEAGVIAIE